MDRKFLEGLGLERETVDTIMTEYGKSINSYKDQLGEMETLKQSNQALQEASQDVNNKYTQLETTLKEKQSSIDDLNKQLTASNLQNLKIQVALDNGLPYTLANRLSGDDQESLTKDAQSLAGLFTQPESPMRSTEPNANSADPYAQMAENLINSMNKGE